MRLLNAFPAPTPIPLVSRLIPPLPPGTSASSIICICLFGVLYFLLLSFICRRYDSVNTGRRLQSCLIRPVKIVVRARGFTGAKKPDGVVGFEMDNERSLGRSG